MKALFTIITLLAAQAVKSYNDSQAGVTPQPFSIEPEHASVIQSEVHSVAAGIRAWHGSTVTTAEQWAITPEQAESAANARAKFEEDCRKQDTAILTFDSIISVFK